MKTANLSKLAFLFFILIFSSRSKGSIVWNTLPDLVHKAPAIVTGKISMQDEKVVLIVENILKGRKQDQITIYCMKWPSYEAAPPRFTDGEKVLLFLFVPEPPFSELDRLMGIHEVHEGEMYLFGLGDQGKWPRIYPERPKGNEYYRHYPRLQDNASLEAIQDVVEKFLKIEDSNDLVKRVNLCAEYIKSENNLLKLTALQYAGQSLLWEVPDGKSFSRSSEEISQMKKSFINGIHDEFMKLIDSNEPSLLAESIRYLKYAQPGEALPVLIRNITNEDRDIRTNTSSALFQLAGELKITGDFVKYNSTEPMENLAAIQKQWNDWWEENKVKFE